MIDPGAPMEDRDFDAALARYSEPPAGFDEAGLAQRVLLRLDATSPAPPVSLIDVLRQWRGWQWAAVGMPLLIVALVSFRFQQKSGEFGSPRSATTMLQPAPPAAQIPRVSASSRLASRPLRPRRERLAVASKPAAHRDRNLPKLDVFPAPVPLSATERALVAIADDPAEAQAVLQRKREAAEPIRIAEIAIEPLDSAKAENRHN